MSENNCKIQLLPPELCNQIAAGEVVERPASVLKELVENSLDAGATQIDARLDNGGQSLVRVQDDGQGIPADELELAVTRHATSKISRLEDMDSIATYGFRGEALPSIASVSRFSITSSCATNQVAAGVGLRLTVEHGRHISLEQVAIRCGTVVEARDIFANMPGRLRFLKQPASEFKRAQGWFTRLAIARPETGFTLAAGDRQIMRLQKGESLRERLRHVWPTEIVDQMLPLNSEMHGISITGLVGPPQLQQPKPDRIFFYVNGRAVNDKRLLAAVREAYKGRLVTRDYPQLVLFIDINPMDVDVNAHPAKTEVRFRNEAAIFSAVYGALGHAFQQDAPVYAAPSPAAPSPAAQQLAPGFWGALDREDDRVRMPPPARAATLPWRVEEPQASPALAEAAAPYQAMAQTAGAAPRRQPAGVERCAEASVPGEATACGEAIYWGQIANTYLVLNENGSLVVIDQHAAHERVLYHRYEQGFMQGSGQKLILPLEFGLEADKKEILAQIGGHLEKLGFGFNAAEDKLLVNVISPSLTRSAARDFLRDVLAGCSGNLEDIWISMACHAAIKAGQALARDEALELIAAWRNTPRRDFCPHGRPCVLRWNEAALERLFKRR